MEQRLNRGENRYLKAPKNERKRTDLFFGRFLLYYLFIRISLALDTLINRISFIPDLNVLQEKEFLYLDLEYNRIVTCRFANGRLIHPQW